MVFKTHKSTEVNFYGLFGEPNAQHWRLIECNIFHPWFCVSVSEIAAERTLHRTLMPSDVQMLMGILNEQSEDFVVTDVLAMMPAWMTGRDRWSLERLIELRSGLDAQNQHVNFYVTDTGAIYQDFGPKGEYIPTGIEIQAARLLYSRPCKN